MPANMITDIVYSAASFKFTGFYFPDSRAQAKAIVLLPELATEPLLVNPVEKMDLEKKFGPDSRKHWYTFDLNATSFADFFISRNEELTLKDTNGVESFITLGNYRERPELERRIRSFLAVVNRFVIQGNEMARALAYWLIYNTLIQEPDFESPVYVHLLSVVALQMNIEGMQLPELHSFNQLTSTCEKLFENEPAKKYLAMTRIACAYGYDQELVDYLQVKNQSQERGMLEIKLPLIVMKLKALLLRSGGGSLEKFSHPDDIGKIFKLGISKVSEMDYLTAEIGEKLSTVCALFHRVFYIREGIDSLRLNEKEFSTLSRKLFIASLGILTEDHLRLYKAEVE